MQELEQGDYFIVTQGPEVTATIGGMLSAPQEVCQEDTSLKEIVFQALVVVENRMVAAKVAASSHSKACKIGAIVQIDLSQVEWMNVGKNYAEAMRHNQNLEDSTSNFVASQGGLMMSYPDCT